ncbi:MAG TPA: FixH family protein [Armatimonadota bacterium]|jgi:hypothetical protein
MRNVIVGAGSLLAVLSLSCGSAVQCQPAAPAPVPGPTGALSATPMAMGRIWAGADLDVHFFLAGRDRPGNIYTLIPVEGVTVTAEVTMPSMPGMAPMTPTVHEEGAPGYYGLSALFPHGGKYHIALTVKPRSGALQSAAFNLSVEDAPEGTPLFTPLFSATVEPDPNPPAAQKPDKLKFKVFARGSQEIWSDFVVVHTKPWHLLVMSNDLRWFDHIHPQQNEDGSFTVEETFPAGGDYLLLSDVSPRGYGQQFLPVPLKVDGAPFATPYHLAPTLLTGSFGGVTVRLDAPSPLKPHQDIPLLFHLSTPDGKPVADLEPYLGAMGHLIIVSEDRTRFVHSHPLSTERTPDGVVRFVARFPKAGLYKAWAQFQRAGKVITSDFVISVAN